MTKRIITSVGIMLIVIAVISIERWLPWVGSRRRANRASS